MREGKLECAQVLDKELRNEEWWKLTHCAEAGRSLDCLKYIHDNGYEITTRTTIEAAKSGNLECLKYIYENFGTTKWNEVITCVAAEEGKFECLKFAIEKGCEMDVNKICNAAASGGNVECLKFVKERGGILNGETCNRAAVKGNVEWYYLMFILKYNNLVILFY